MPRTLCLALVALACLLVPATDSAAAPRASAGKWTHGPLQWLKPNLTVDSLSVTKANRRVMQQVVAQAVVRNNGLLPTGPCGVSTYTTVDGVLVIRHFWYSQGLAPGESKTMTWNLPAAAYGTTQSYGMAVFADPNGAVDESSENDNVATYSVVK